MPVMTAEDWAMLRRPQWEIGYNKKDKEYQKLAKAGERALRNGNAKKAAELYANARKAHAERNAIMERHLKENERSRRGSVRFEESLGQKGRIFDRARWELSIAQAKREIRSFQEAIQAEKKEIPKSAYRVDTQKLVPGKQIEVAGMEHAVYELVGTHSDSRLKEITQKTGRKLKKGDSVLLEMDPGFLALCREINKIFRMQNPAAYQPPKTFQEEEARALEWIGGRWTAGLAEIEKTKEKGRADAAQQTRNKQHLKDDILNQISRIQTDPLDLGSASMISFATKLIEHWKRKGIEIIPMDSPYSHKAASKIRREHAKLVCQREEAERRQFEAHDWDKVVDLKEKVRQSYTKGQK